MSDSFSLPNPGVDGLPIPIAFQPKISNFSITPDNSIIYRLYAAAFARLPDEGGFNYWVSQFNKGVNLSDISKSFLNSAEFSSKYGLDSSNSQLVNSLYKNILGRDGEPSGVDYWTKLLDTGASTKDMVLIGFAGSTENVMNTAKFVDDGYWLL